MTRPDHWGNRTLRVEGGIRARSTRGAIGSSWWSKRFLAVLESFALGTRLTRGRNYARAGQVLSLDITPGAVEATVQGSRPKPYEARIGLAVFPGDVWARVEAALAAEALGAAKLLAGELPPHVEDVFTGAGAPLFPARITDLGLHCSCPDSAVPCKHLAATFYLLAERFDADPFQILLWRGRARDALLANLRELRTGADSAAPAEAAEAAAVAGAGAAALGGAAVPAQAAQAAALADTGAEPSRAAPLPTRTARVLAELTEPEVELERFWVPPVPVTDPEPVAVAERDLLLRQLPTPGPALGGPELLRVLRSWYR
ncbi:SWIM zinc finger family protein [Dactylosporangium fulvum]|uniref:SWIM zinc finger family protein n=1 Tax=Dactylosporangium fulvum TaxID=53359 RepID=A0ABY5W593_9ACTN|nr:SWIM zinc finger family protein [Dactylosporangium fulvum]UWP84717.1 SWIM zinc finger family protein [Dactylosporangium fulvum]